MFEAPSRRGAELGVVAAVALSRPAAPWPPWMTLTGGLRGSIVRHPRLQRVIPAQRMFSNPLLPSPSLGDPWIIRWQGDYYLTGTVASEDRLVVWRSPTLTGFGASVMAVVWRAPARGGLGAQVWAPELHRIDGRWNLYFTAGDGRDESHRLYVLVADAPLGPYREMGRVDPALDDYAIDGSVMKIGDRLFWLYAAHDGLWAARMESPLRAGPRRIRIAVGDQDWEHAWLPSEGGGWVRSENAFWIEAPQALLKSGRVFVTYSAGHSATPQYAIGLLECVGNPMEPSSWIKHPGPVFGPWRGDDGDVLTVGHASFTQSPDGMEDWIVYHAKDRAGDSFKGRTVRAQRFGWSQDGRPDFGRPIPSGIAMPRPSGE